MAPGRPAGGPRHRRRRPGPAPDGPTAGTVGDVRVRECARLGLCSWPDDGHKTMNPRFLGWTGGSLPSMLCRVTGEEEGHGHIQRVGVGVIAAVPFMLVFRFLHIVTGVLWVGSSFLFVGFIGPSAVEVGPSAGQLLSAAVKKRKASKVIIGLGLTTVVAG